VEGAQWDSGSDAELFHKSVRKVDDEIPLGCAAVSGTGAAYTFHAANEEFQLEPSTAHFHRKYMRLTIAMFKLGGSKEVIGYANPVDLFEAGCNRIFFEKPPDPFQIRGGEFINQVGFHERLLFSIRSNFLPARNASTTE